MANRYPFQQSQSQHHVGVIRPGQHPIVHGVPGSGMWPQHQQPRQQQATEDHKQREYLKQQQKLRLMAASSHKQTVSADKLIENLLEKKETFRPKSSQQAATSSGRVPGAQSQMLGRIIPGMVPAHASSGARPMGYPPFHPMSPNQPSTSLLATTESPTGYSPSTSGGLPFKGFGGATNVLPQTEGNNTSQLPNWLSPQCSGLPALYRQVWALVGQKEGLVDTSRIFPLLLTSGLPTDVLGYIWGLANQKIAGHLTEQELYVMLALVALAQSGCTFNSLSILNLIPQPPVPNLNLATVTAVAREGESSQAQGKMRREELNLQATGKFRNLDTMAAAKSSKGTEGPHEEIIDDFTDFQSATCEASNASKVKVSSLDIPAHSIESIPVSSPAVPTQSFSAPVTTTDSIQIPKFPSVLVVGSHSRGIGSRLANHSLGAPKQTKTRHHKHHHHHHHRSHQQTSPNLVIAVEDEFSDFQQAKDLVNTESSDSTELFPKCVLKLSQNKMFLLKESAIRTEINLNDTELEKQGKELAPTGDMQTVHAESGLDSTVQGEFALAGKEDVGSTSEEKLPTAPKDRESKELMSVEEDKYSALRALAFVNQSNVTEKITPTSDQSALSDDFGDFLSAESPVNDDSFADIASRDKSVSINKPVSETSSDVHWQAFDQGTSQSAEFEVDNWGAFESVPSSNKLNNVGTASINLCNLESDPNISLGIENLDLNTNQGLPHDPSKTVSGNQQNMDVDFDVVWSLEMRDDSTQPYNADKNSSLTFLGKIYNDDGSRRYSGKDDLLGIETDQNNAFGVKSDDYEDDFGDFIGPEVWPEDGKLDVHSSVGMKDVMFDSQSVSSLELPPLALSRHGSLPSLDLKIFPTSAEKTGGQQSWDLSPQGAEHQVREWCRCVQSCLSLLQSAAVTFNSITSEEVVREVVRAHEGRDYLYNLLEVFGVCRRLQCSSREVTTDLKQLELLLADVDKTWTELESYYMKADISIDLGFLGSVPESSQDHSACGICLASVAGDQAAEQEDGCNTSQLEYGGQTYHAACANLWVNCVDCSLPALGANSALL